MALSDLVFNITGNAGGFHKAVSGVTGGLRGLGNAGQKVTGVLKLSFAGLAASLAPLVAAFKGFMFLGDASELAKTQIAAEKKLGAVLKSTGYAAGFSAGELAKLASERQAVTNFGDEATLAATGILATFKEIKGDNFKAAIPLMQDMAAVMEGDLNGAAMQLGKALNDPVAGLGALSRVGVQFSHEQKEMIKGLVETGQLAKAQGIIMEELTSQFGGAAEAMADPLTQAANSWGDFKEQIGMVFNDIKAAALEAFGFQDIMASTGSLAATFKKEWLPAVKAGLSRIANVFRNVIDWIKQKWTEWLPTVKHAFEEAKAMWRSTVAFLKDTWNDWEPVITEGINNIKQAFLGAGQSLSETFNFEGMKSGYAAFAEEFKNTWSPVIVAGIKEALDMVAAMIRGFQKLGDWIDDVHHKMALKKLQKNGQMAFGVDARSLSLEQFKELAKLSKDADRTQGWIDDILKKNRIQAFNSSMIPKATSKPDPFITEIQSFLNNLNKPGSTAARGVSRDDFAASTNNSIAAGTQAAFEKIFNATSGQNKLQNLEKQTAKNTEKTADAVVQMERHLERIERKIGKEVTVELIG